MSATVISHLTPPFLLRRLFRVETAALFVPATHEQSHDLVTEMEQRKGAHSASAWSVTPPSSLHLLDISTEENAENAPEVMQEIKEHRKLYASGITEACMLSQEWPHHPGRQPR